MKRELWSKAITRARSGLFIMALGGMAFASQAQEFANPKTFDTGIGSWITWNGWGIQGFLSWDSTLDAANDPASGSLRYDVPFVGAGGEQFMTFGTFADRWGWDGGIIINTIGNYKNMVFDIRMDPATAVAKNGTFGYLEVGLTTDGWGQVNLTNFTMAATMSGWNHVVAPIDWTKTGVEKANGYYIKMWSDGNYTNTMSFNVDNLWLEPATNVPPPAPPTMGIEKAGPSGVMITMDTTYQWQRDGITTPAGGGPYLWTSQGSYPVTYSCTIADFPNYAVHGGFEAHMYMVNGDTATSGDQTSGSPDWGAPDLLIFRLENIADGLRAMIQWKTNHPASNATNVPVNVTAPSAIGTWSVTFTDATHGTMTGPGITATNFTLPEDAVLNNFSPGSSFIHFGMFKADGANDGHNDGAHGTYSRVQFSGAAGNSFDDDFSGPTLTNKYEWRASSQTAVQHIAPGTDWMVNWTMPAIGFNPQSAATLAGPWNPTAFTKTFRAGKKTVGLLAHSALPSPTAGFFRLISRPFTKLQVLMPGETAAPNTPTGKTGTPDAQLAGVAFNVTVNSVDEMWNLVSSSDTITITSSDSIATLPPDAALVNGSKTFSVVFNSAGSFTVTATDVTDATKTANTGSPTLSQ